MAQAKARVRRAAKRAGVSVRLSEGEGILYYERTGQVVVSPQVKVA